MGRTVPSLGFVNGMGLVVASVLLYNLGSDGDKPAIAPAEAEEEDGK